MSLRTILIFRCSIYFYNIYDDIFGVVMNFHENNHLCVFVWSYIHLIVYKSMCFNDFLFYILYFSIILGVYFKKRIMMIIHDVSCVKTYLVCSLIFRIFLRSYFEMKVYIFVIVGIKNRFWIFDYLLELIYDTIHVFKNNFHQTYNFLMIKGPQYVYYECLTHDKS